MLRIGASSASSVQRVAFANQEMAKCISTPSGTPSERCLRRSRALPTELEAYAIPNQEASTAVEGLINNFCRF
jgi:hypothetical protein